VRSGWAGLVGPKYPNLILIEAGRGLEMLLEIQVEVPEPRWRAKGFRAEALSVTAAAKP
jgi:hypothetical protein